MTQCLQAMVPVLPVVMPAMLGKGNLIAQYCSAINRADVFIIRPVFLFKTGNAYDKIDNYLIFIIPFNDWIIRCIFRIP